ncbi:TPA: phage tail protein [Enterobacter roggenkampii]
MTAKYYAILTTLGAAKLANAIALGTKLEITTMAVGDGGGVLPTPDASQTAIVGEQRRAPINMLSIDPANPGQIIAEQVIPENEGGFWIRTIGLYDKDGTLIAVANCPETYKPQLQEGSGRTQTIRMILIVSNTDAITLKIDPSVVLATRKYVDDRTIEVKAYADELMAAHLASANPHNQYAPKASPALTGTPTAPTPAKTDNTTKLATTAHVKLVAADYAPLASPAFIGTPTAPTAAQTVNNTQIATTAYVKAALAALVDSSPAALDTLNELAAALGDDPNFAATMTTELSKKMDKASNGADIPDVAAFLTNLDLITNGAVGRLMGSPKRFTSSGTYTPTAGTKFIIVEQVGGGGGGGGVPATSSTAYTASAGGGAGAYASGIFTSGFSGVTVTIGAGGTGGPAGANTGGNGGTTSFGSLLIAPGGVGGGPGVAGMTTPHMVPNGGASAEPTGANIVGFAGVASTTAFAYTIGNILGSSGASCPFGTGGWQPAASGFRSGSGFGSGASGSNQGPSLAAAAGGTGQPGVVIVWEYA